jgi:hypothetical protein
MHLPKWDLKELKDKYGDKLCFHGGIDNQHVLPFGSDDELEEEIKVSMEILSRNKQVIYVRHAIMCRQIQV